MRQFIREGEFIGALTVHQDGVDLVDGGVDGLHQDGHVLQPLGVQDVVPERGAPALGLLVPRQAPRAVVSEQRLDHLLVQPANKHQQAATAITISNSFVVTDQMGRVRSKREGDRNLLERAGPDPVPHHPPVGRGAHLVPVQGLQLGQRRAVLADDRRALPQQTRRRRRRREGRAIVSLRY